VAVVWLLLLSVSAREAVDALAPVFAGTVLRLQEVVIHHQSGWLVPKYAVDAGMACMSP